MRLENMILITDDASIDLMTDIPIELDEVEALMASIPPRATATKRR